MFKSERHDRIAEFVGGESLMSEETRSLPPTADPSVPGNTRDVNHPTAVPRDSGTSPLADSFSSDVSGRYVLGDEIARGGMGVIHRATDTVLGREVAIKVLRENFAPTSGAARRFADEARISAQLQHPAVPPVHDLGTLSDGRPFLAMKLIKGDALDRLLANRADPTADRGRFVAVFEQICQALAYAHAHRVIHRDLKPANVMVGNFGEVQVMDWGLAKVLGTRTAEAFDPETTASATAVNSLRDSDDSFTQAGSVLGTPAFMPPEQALGAIGKIDARSDVFGLGAILAVILTGVPPFASRSAETTRIQAAQGKVDECFGRLDGCGSDPGLVALCKRCLSPAPADRPADAGEVARAVAELRQAADERARRAELDRVKAEGEKAAAVLQADEQRKRRRVQLALAAAIGLLAFGGGAVAWWANEQSNERERSAEADRQEKARQTSEVERAVIADLELAYRDANDDRWVEARVALARAAERVSGGLGSPAAIDALAHAEKDIKLAEDLDFSRLLNEMSWDIHANEYREVFKRHGVPVVELAPEEAVERLRGCRVLPVVIRALDGAGRFNNDPAQRRKYLAVAALLDPDPWRMRVRDAVAADDKTALNVLAREQTISITQLDSVLLLADSLPLDNPEILRLLLAYRTRRPDHFWLNMHLGSAYRALGSEHFAESVGYYRAAVALRPKSFLALNMLGNVLFFKEDWAAALTCFRGLLEITPNASVAHHNIARIQAIQGDDDGAIASYRTALKLGPRLELTYWHLAIVIDRKKDWDLAVKVYQDAVGYDPKSVNAYVGLGKALHYQGDLDGAVVAFREAFRLSSGEAIRLSPGSAPARNNLGWSLESLGDVDGAAVLYREAVRLVPKEPIYARNLVRADRLRELLARVPDIVAGKATSTTPAEMCELAQLCARPFKKQYMDAFGLFTNAFATDPTLMDAVAEHRYNAACFAVMAARGEGVHAPADPSQRSALRTKAMGWLQKDLAFWKKQAISSNASDRNTAAFYLTHWLKDSDLAGIRNPFLLASLPADEVKVWLAFWAEVRAARDEALKPLPVEIAPPPRVGRSPLPRGPRTEAEAQDHRTAAYRPRAFRFSRMNGTWCSMWPIAS